MMAAALFFYPTRHEPRHDISSLVGRIQVKDIAGVTSIADIHICSCLILIPTQHMPGSFVMQITRVIRVRNVLLAGAYLICGICAFHSLITEALCQIDYLVN